MRGRDFDHLPCGSHVRSFPESWPFFHSGKRDSDNGSAFSIDIERLLASRVFSRAWSNRRLAPSLQSTGPDDRHTLGHIASDRHHHHHEKRFDWIVHGVAERAHLVLADFPGWLVYGPVDARMVSCVLSLPSLSRASSAATEKAQEV